MTTAAIRCPCGREHTIDVTPSAERGQLVELAGGWCGRSGAVLKNAARAGDLRAFEVEQGKVVAWERDLLAWLESRPAKRGEELEPLESGPGMPSRVRRAG